MAKLSSYFMTIIIPLIIYALTFLMLPIYISLWYNFVLATFPLLTISVLGYIFAGVAIAGAILALVLKKKKKKHEQARYACAWIFVFCIIIAVQLIYPLSLWFTSVWSFY